MSIMMLTASWNRGSSSIKGGTVGCWPARPIPQSKTNMNEKEKKHEGNTKSVKTYKPKSREPVASFISKKSNRLWPPPKGCCEGTLRGIGVKAGETMRMQSRRSSLFNHVSSSLTKIGGNLVLFSMGFASSRIHPFALKGAGHTAPCNLEFLQWM